MKRSAADGRGAGSELSDHERLESLLLKASAIQRLYGCVPVETQVSIARVPEQRAPHVPSVLCAIPAIIRPSSARERMPSFV